MDYPQTAGIYLLRNLINNKIYVGKAVNIKRRLTSHKASQELKYKGSSLIERAIFYHKWNNFSVQILELTGCMPNEEILFRESLWIKFYDSTNIHKGYNLLKFGTDCTGIVVSQETREKLSKAAKNKYPKGQHFNCGRKVSDETKKKMSLIRKGKPNGHKGKKLSPKHIECIRQSALYRDRSSQKIPVKQIDKITREVIKIWDSASDAAEGLGFSRRNPTINKACTKRKDKRGYYIKTALGFKWEYVD